MQGPIFSKTIIIFMKIFGDIAKHNTMGNLLKANFFPSDFYF